MTEKLLSVLNIIMLTCFVYSGLRLVEHMTEHRRREWWYYVVVGVGTGILTTLLHPLPVALLFLAATIIVFAVLYFLFGVTGINNLYSTLALMICAMGLRGVTAAIVSICTGCSIHEVFTIEAYFSVASIGANALCCVILYVIEKYAPEEKILMSLKPRAGKDFLICWMAGSALLLYINALLYTFEVDSTAYSVLEGILCAVLIASCYAVLRFTFRLNRDEDAANSLNRELLAQDKLQSALVQNALFIAKANLTKNQITDGLAVYSETFGKEVKYDDWLEFTKFKVHPDDIDHFLSVLNRPNLFACYAQGSEPDPFSYRRLGTDDEYHWVKISIRLYSETTTGDVHIVGYALDVDKDMKEKAELQRRAQTDSLTKLLNRDTAEKAIVKEITNGCGALFLMDIDDFKDVNDCMGHDTGDKVLISAAKRLQSFFGESNIVGRLGGDEFVAYLKNVNDTVSLHEQAEKLVSFLGLPPEAPDEPTISFSVGVAPVHDGSVDFKTVYSQADSALYEKKYNGKHGYMIYSDKK